MKSKLKALMRKLLGKWNSLPDDHQVAFFLMAACGAGHALILLLAILNKRQA